VALCRSGEIRGTHALSRPSNTGDKTLWHAPEEERACRGYAEMDEQGSRRVPAPIVKSL